MSWKERLNTNVADSCITGTTCQPDTAVREITMLITHWSERAMVNVGWTKQQIVDAGYAEWTVKDKEADVLIKDDLAEDSGGSCDYYQVDIMNPTTPSNNEGEHMHDATYTAECNDIIETLDMTYAEANMFKEIWRTAAARTLGKGKANHTTKRGAEKIVFFANRHAVQHGVAV